MNWWPDPDSEVLLPLHAAFRHCTQHENGASSCLAHSARHLRPKSPADKSWWDLGRQEIHERSAFEPGRSERDLKGLERSIKNCLALW